LSFRLLSLQQLQTFKLNLIYEFIIGIHRWSMNFGKVWWFLSYSSSKTFLFPISNFCRNLCRRLKLNVLICHSNTHFKFEFGHGPMTLTELSLIKLEKMNFSVSAP
jgi:hypothetical protein